MSYARFGWDNSDVYIYTTRMSSDPLEYAIDCCGCLLERGEKLDTPYVDVLGVTHEYAFYGFKAYTSGEMVAHLKKHLAVKHVVPQDTFDRILSDYPDESKPITEYEIEYEKTFLDKKEEN